MTNPNQTKGARQMKRLVFVTLIVFLLSLSVGMVMAQTSIGAAMAKVLPAVV